MAQQTVVYTGRTWAKAQDKNPYYKSTWKRMEDSSRVKLAQDWVGIHVQSELNTNSRARAGAQNSVLIDMGARANQSSGVTPNPVASDVTSTWVRVWPCSTLVAANIFARAMAAAGETRTTKIGVLNMASGREAGGHFLKGTTAAEESLCIGSTLYASLKPEFYNKYWRDRYLVYSPDVRVLRLNPDVKLLPHERFYMDVISLQAVINPHMHPDGTYLSWKDEDRMKQKIKDVLDIAVERGITHLVLGALGCGVYRNPPASVAELMRSVLESKDWRGMGISNVVIAIYDHEETMPVFESFCDVFDGMENTIVDWKGSDLFASRTITAQVKSATVTTTLPLRPFSRPHRDPTEEESTPPTQKGFRRFAKPSSVKAKTVNPMEPSQHAEK